MKKGGNSLLVFLAGLAMLVSGLYWFLNSVQVHTSFIRGISWGGSSLPTGLIVVPFIAGIIWLFVDFDSIVAKFLIGIGVLIIIAAIISSTTFHLRSMNLYEYLLMFVFIFGGGALVCKVLFQTPPSDKNEKK